MMNPDPIADRKLYDQLETELTRMIDSGVADPESWFNASTFTPGEAQRWDGLGFTAEGAIEWIAAFRADPDAVATWARVGMDPVEPSLVAEALAAGLDPLRWQAWRLAGYSHSAAAEWVDYRFSIGDALAWVESGSPDPIQASEWTGRGFSPSAARPWRTAIREVADFVTGWVEVGFTPEEGALCRSAGVARPPELEDRVPGDMTAAIAAGRVELARHSSWAVGYRRPR